MLLVETLVLPTVDATPADCLAFETHRWIRASNTEEGAQKRAAKENADRIAYYPGNSCRAPYFYVGVKL